MNHYTIDCKNVETSADFFAQLKKTMPLPDYFGNNLDALYDIITGYIELPVRWDLTRLTLKKIDLLSELFKTLDDAEFDTNMNFYYICSLDI